MCLCIACSDADLRSLASRLKDWFGVLHLDANRDLKTSANDNAQGRKHSFYIFCAVFVCVHAFHCITCVVCMKWSLFSSITGWSFVHSSLSLWQALTPAFCPSVRTLLGGCLTNLIWIMTSYLTNQSSAPSTWTNMSCACGRSSTLAILLKMENSPTTSGATASRNLRVRERRERELKSESHYLLYIILLANILYTQGRE